MQQPRPSTHGLGVSRDTKRRGKQFRARVFYNGNIDLGRFATAHEARLAYDQAVRALSGPRHPIKPTNYSAGEYQYFIPAVQRKVQRHLEAKPYLNLHPAAPALTSGTVESTVDMWLLGADTDSEPSAAAAAAPSSQAAAHAEELPGAESGPELLPHIWVEDLPSMGVAFPELPFPSAADLLAAPGLAQYELGVDDCNQGFSALLSDLLAEAAPQDPNSIEVAASSHQQLQNNSEGPTSGTSSTTSAVFSQLSYAAAQPAAPRGPPQTSSHMLLSPQQQASAAGSMLTAGQTVQFVDASVSRLMQLYTRLSGQGQQHGGLAAVQWMSGVRVGLEGAELPDPVRAAVLHTCASLVTYGANDSAGVQLCDLTGPFNRGHLLSALEQLVEALLSFRELCIQASPLQGLASGILQAWQVQLASQAHTSAVPVVTEVLGWLLG